MNVTKIVFIILRMLDKCQMLNYYNCTIIVNMQRRISNTKKGENHMGEDVSKVYLKAKDLQVVMGIGRDKAYQLMHSQSFPSTMIGGNYYVSRDALDRWMVGNERKKFVL